MGIAWHEEVPKAEQVGSVSIGRRGVHSAGKRGERRGRTYQDELRPFRVAQSGWRTAGFGLGRGHEAYDTELSALVYGLIHLHGIGGVGRTYTIFTDSTAAMRRAANDAPGLGQELAIRIIELAGRMVEQGNSIAIGWTPAHRGVEGNERADQSAKEMVALPPLRAMTRRYSITFLRRRATERATQTWRADIERRNAGRRTFRLPTAASRPSIRPQLRRVGKRVAARFFQLLSSHAMTAPFLGEG